LDEAEEGGFTTAGGAHDGDELPGFEAGVDVLQDPRLFALGAWGFVAQIDEVDSHGQDGRAGGVGVFVALASLSWRVGVVVVVVEGEGGGGGGGVEGVGGLGGGPLLLLMLVLVLLLLLLFL